jgi:subtilase-type serine protease
MYFFLISSNIAVWAADLCVSEFETLEYKANWGLGAINASTAYAHGWTGKGVLIGIIDDGYDQGHLDLASQILVDGSDGLVYVHGTHVAGIAAAVKNDIGMHGVAYDARLALFNFGTLKESAESFRTLAALSPASINNSWGYDLNINNILDDPDYISGAHDAYDSLSKHLGSKPEDWKEFVDAMRLAQKDSVIVFAASNWPGLGDIDVSAAMPLLFPDLNAFLAVVNVNQDLELMSVHCGSAADFCLAAPGTSIYSTIPGDNYANLTGTSMAAPHVSGAVAVAAQMYPGASSRELAGLILITATDIGEPGIDKKYGWGLLNLGNLVQTSSSSGRAIFSNAKAARKQTAVFVSSIYESRLKYLRLNDARHERYFYAGTMEVFSGLAMNDSGTIMDVNARDRSSRSGSIWSKTFQGKSRVPSGGSGSGSTSNVIGGVFGLDLWAGENFVLGLGGGVSSTKTSMNDRGQATADVLHGFIYSSIGHESWFVDLVAGINRFDQEHTRKNMPGLSGTVVGSQKPAARSRTVEIVQTLNIRPGYTFSTPDWLIEPYISGTLIRQRSSSAKETGVPILGYNLKRTATTQYQYGAGTSLARKFDLQAVNVTAGLDLGYFHFPGNRTARVKTEMLGSSFTAKTPDPGKDAFRLGGMLGLESPSGRFSAIVSGYKEFRRSPSQLLEVGLSLRF